MKENKVIRVAIYIRVSTEEQVRHGYSLQSQKERLTEYCNQHKYKIIGYYADEGKTARSKLKNRKELLRLIEDAKESKFDRIVFWRLDRWFRNIADYYKIQEVLDQHKIDWECSDEEYNTTTSNGRLHLNIKLSIAQNESDQTSDRIKFNFANMVKNKRVIVGSQGMPLGYTIGGTEKEKRMIKDPKTEHIAKDMLEHIKKSGAIRQTLLYINEKYNLTICYDSMRHYLMNTKYYGYYRGVENYCEPYITKEEFEEIQSIVRRNNKMNKRYDYIFSGLLKCPICGCRLAGFTVKITNRNGKKVDYKYPSYRCNHTYNDKLCTYRKRMVESTIEKFLLDNIADILKSKIIEIESVTSKEEKKKNIDITKIEQKLDRLNDLYIEGKISKDKYDTEYQKINEQLDTAKQNNQSSQQKRDLRRYKEFLNSDILSIYDKLNNRSKRMFWAKYIDYIEKDLNDQYHVHLK